MKLPGHVCNVWDDCRTSILCPGRHSWECHERCTAVLICCLMIFPYGGYDEENCITELALITVVMVERKKLGGQGFFH